MTVSFHPLAERELNDAAYYYDGQNLGLGSAFLDEVERSCADIASFPHAGATLEGAIRRRIVRRSVRVALHRAGRHHQNLGGDEPA